MLGKQNPIFLILLIIMQQCIYTVSGKKEATLFSTITLVSLGGFLYFLPLETRMNTAQIHVIYLLNGLMTT